MPEVLVVCTANICRSPLAAVLLDSYLRTHLPPGVSVAVTSAGVRAREGHAATDHMVTIAQDWGLDLHAHQSRAVTAERAAAADLVITMERAHRDAIARLAPGLAERTFTLPELAALAEQVAPDSAQVPAGLPALVRRLHGARARVWAADGDVADPIGGPRAGYDATASELLAYVERIGPVLTAALART